MSKYEEALEIIDMYDTDNVELHNTDEWALIKQAILKAKAFDVIKEKRVNVERLIFVGSAYNEHNVYATLTDEEFDLLKQVLEVDEE